MSAADLKRWMSVKGKSPIDVASALKVNTVTVERFLKGKRVRPIVEDALKRMIAQDPISEAGGDQKATG